jgi:hypothetical protein
MHGNIGNLPTIDPNDITITGISLPHTITDTTYPNIFEDFNSKPVESVKGEMLLVEKRFSPNEVIKSYDQSFVDGIKKQMVHELAEEILKNKYVEFTKQEDLKTSEVIYRARVYLTPDDQVRKLRKVEK